MHREDEQVLRSEAENIVEARTSSPNESDASRDSLKATIHELEVHQVELEIQNERLRETELELHEARDRYFDLFDLAPVAYVTLGQDGSIVEANLTAATLLGVERQKLVRRKISAFVESRDVGPFHLYWRRVLEKPGKQSCELLLECEDGKRFPARLESIAIRSGEGGSPQIRTAIMDLTEVARARDDASRSAARFDNVAQSMMDSLVLLAPDGTIQDVNEPTLALLGYTREELIGLPVSAIVLAEDENTEAGMSGEGFLGRWEKTYMAKDGQAIAVDFSASPVRNPDTGIIESIACIAHDISESKASVERLRKSELQFRQMAERIEDVFYILEVPSLVVSYVSPAYEGVFGGSAKELQRDPRAWIGHVDKEDRSRVVAAYQQLLQGDPIDEEYPIRHPNGDTRWIRDRAFPILDESGRIVRIIGMAQDITNQRQLQEELRQSHKMEAVGQLASGVAHDFNNLLMGILGCTNIAMKTRGTPEQMHYLEEIKKSAEGGGAIIGQLLAFTRKGEAHESTIDLNAAIASTEAMLSRLLGDEIRLDVKLATTESLYVRLEEGQLEQMLLNLAVNARDAMRGGGVLSVVTDTSAIYEGDPRCSPHFSAGDYVVLRVSDTGSGMSAQTRRRVFEPFFTTKEVGKGTGLGLSTIYGIVRGARGHIEVHSKLGQGTSFEIFLPRAEKPTLEESEPQEARSGLAKDTVVLLVEDEGLVRMACKYYLEQGGYQVLEAQNGNEALQICREYPGPIDVVVTDMALPGLGGGELYRKASELRPDLRVVFMSAHSSEWLIGEGRLEPGTQTLHKPFTNRELLETLGKVLWESPLAESSHI